MPESERRLAAIMFTDMVGYTALTQSNESLAMRVLEKHNQLLRPFFQKFHGKEVKTIGDSFLVEFESVLDAVNCAVEMQSFLHDHNASAATEWKTRLRIGIHLGDVIHQGNDAFGDAVNIASRIEPVAEPEGICLTEQVYDQIHNKFQHPLISRGDKSLKNVNKPIGVYTVQMPWEDKSSSTILDPHRIAVLPFANMSPDPNDSYFADGITEEIISTVSNIGGLSVISRTSVMGYKGTTKRVKEIGRELEVGSVLEGSFRKAGSKIRVTAQLIAVNDDRHVWAQSYDRNLDDVFAVQTDIAKQVSDALRVKILAEEMDRIDRKPTESTKAYSLYLRGRHHWNKRSVEDIRKAAEYFEQALKEDPRFALGYVGLADCHEIIGTNFEIERTANREKARSALARALELDESLAEAHATRGLILMNDFKLVEAEKEFKKAIQLKPSYASAHQWYFHVLRAELRWDEALTEIEKAVELDPFMGVINANYASYFTSRKDYAKAIELQKKAMELNPGNPLGHFDLALIYGEAKMFDKMRDECKIAASLTQREYPYVGKSTAAVIAYFDGDLETLRQLIPELEERVGQIWSPDAMEVAGICFRLGDKDRGFEWLEKSYERREFGLMNMKNSTLFDSVRDDPRYRDWLRRLGLD